ncbi:MAG: carbohydrate-binding protein [Elusimicrobia bacterium]|nr:carbohydrate-binding protein [Elusimicrobiota bacterium]
MQKLLKVVCNFVVCMFVLGMFAGNVLFGITDTTPPAKITYFLTAYPTAKTVTLVWRSVGDDGNSGTATKYDIRYSLSPITTEAEWNSATKIICDLTPSSASSAESFIVFGLSPSTKYYFAIKAGDEVPNWSPLSKSPSGTTPALTDTIPPGKITDLTTNDPTPNSITLKWSAPANDDNSNGQAARYIPYDMNRQNPTPQSQWLYRLASRYIPYDIRYSLSPITDANWDSATKVQGTPAAQQVFNQEMFTVVGLSPSTKYYFAIKTADEVPNWSVVSNSPCETTKALGLTTPYKGVPFQIPCKIELEDFDNGGQGVSYYDTTKGNAVYRDIPTGEPENAYRKKVDVDVEPYSGASGGYDIGWVMAGEWLKYTINTKAAGTYTIEVQVGCGGNGGNFHIEFDDVDKTGQMTVPNTGGWQTFQTLKKTGVSLSAGKHIMKLIMDTSGTEATGNFDYINIISEGQLKPVIIVTLPYGNENWVASSKKVVTWTTQGTVGNVNIDLSTDGGTKWTTIVSNTANDGSETIIVPNIDSSACKIRVQDINGSPVGISNNNFKISLTPPNDKLLFYEGAVYPNPNLAPVNPPYLISWRAGPGEQPHETVNYAGYKWADKSWHDEMITKGKLPIPFTYASRNDAKQSANPEFLDTEEKMYNKYIKIAQEGYYGIEIDEWVAWETDDRVKESINALRRVKKQYPNVFMTAGYYGDGFDDTMASASDIINIYEPEIYIYPGSKDYRTYIKKWTDWIKYYGFEGKNIGILSGGDDFHGHPADIDLWIKYLRAESPQMAGLGISIFKLYALSTPERAEFDKVMDDNFFKLSPSVSITTPTNNAKLRGTVKIAVSAAKNSETGNPVVSYRYFIDNKLVKISSNPEYIWNTTGYSKGNHIITVHAVADDYLAGVSQVNVRL